MKHLLKLYTWSDQHFWNLSSICKRLQKERCNFTQNLEYCVASVTNKQYSYYSHMQISHQIASMRFHNFLGSIMQQSLVFWTRLRRLLSRRRLLCRRLRQTAISYGLMTKLAPKLPPHIFVHILYEKHIHTKDYIDKRLSKPKLSAAPGNSCTLYARFVGWRHYTALHMRGGGELRRHCLGAVAARRGDI